jgi:hypothetical protein
MVKKIFTERTVFYFLLVTHFLYVWLLPVFVTQDGPCHLYNSKIFLDLMTGKGTEFYLQYYDLNLSLFPNWFSTIGLSFLLLFFTPVIAEKVFISVLIIALPLTFRFALRTINPRAVYLSSLAFILSNNYFLLFGFYNFQWSLVFFCLFIALYLKYGNRMSVKYSVMLSLLGVLIFFTHPIALILIMILIGSDFIRAGYNMLSAGIEEKRLMVFHISHLLLMALPSFILFIIYFFGKQSSGGSLFELKLLSFHYWGNLLFPITFKVFSVFEIYLIIGFSILLFINLGFAILKLIKQYPSSVAINLLVILAFCVFLYFFIADQFASGGFITIRTSMFIYITLMLLSATVESNLRIRQLTILSGLVISITLLVIRYPNQTKIGQLTMNYIEMGKHLPDKITLLPLGFSNRGEIGQAIHCPGLELLGGISGYIGASGQYICFNNYEAGSDHFPIIFKKQTDPYVYMSKFYGYQYGLGSNPPSVDILAYTKRPNCNVDYVITWGDPERFLQTPEMMDLNSQLKKDYLLQEVSPDNLTTIYVRNNLMKTLPKGK